MTSRYDPNQPGQPLPWSFEGAVCKRVVDGDTQDFLLSRTDRVDVGFHVSLELTSSSEQRLRLNRINCPPADTTEGEAATAYVTARLLGTTTAPAESVLIVHTYKYGDEWMAEVVMADGSNLSDDLVTAGLAVYWDGEGPRPGG